MARRKLSKGKQKIEMKRIQNEDDRLITFSKRRSGIYKKSSELVTLCGAEIGFLVFSPAGKPFSFGYPSVETIANRFLGLKINENSHPHPLIEAYRKMKVQELTQMHNDMISNLEAEKAKGAWLKAAMMRDKGKGKEINWWDAPLNELNREELEKLYALFEEVHTILCRKLTVESINGGASSSQPQAQAQAPMAEPVFADEPAANDMQNTLNGGYDFGFNQETSLRKFYPRLG
ncbi:agamous-like MADS-box protein AGL61 [Euphorbia lathyris]|uniref:agamous-like MADS-box protein AGL61 n=1 Tax=Euphorbia lathyris TaxID=212925 RepID=UPI0033144D1A